jgi:hypothetical protein
VTAPGSMFRLPVSVIPATLQVQVQVASAVRCGGLLGDHLLRHTRQQGGYLRGSVLAEQSRLRGADAPFVALGVPTE